MRVAGGRQQFAYDGMTFEDGCLVKVVSIKGLRWGDDVTPSLPELERRDRRRDRGDRSDGRPEKHARKQADPGPPPHPHPNC